MVYNCSIYNNHPETLIMKDHYGREFQRDLIKHKTVSMVDLKDEGEGFKELADYTDEELRMDGVLITDPVNGDRIFLLSELQSQLKANHYCRLTNPFNNQDILDQVPDFKVAIELEHNAPHYNAYILNKNPDFIPLLKTYVEEVLNPPDGTASKNINKNDIKANASKKLDAFYQALADFPQEKQNEFYSLFITNRRLYKTKHFWTFPAKWVPAETIPDEYANYLRAIKTKQYQPFPHRNVLVSDLINNPEDGCMHSWGMDLLYLLLEYHIGSNQPFRLFNASNKEALDMELTLTDWVKQKIQPASLLPEKGRELSEQAKAVVSNQLPADSKDILALKIMIIKLEQECKKYIEYLLLSLGCTTKGSYPSPDIFTDSDVFLVKKYQMVYELYSTLIDNTQGMNETRRFKTFNMLFNQPERQEVLSAHRDNFGIRFLNIVLSIMTLGIKNLVTNYFTGGYNGFWQSRGANFNDAISTNLDTLPVP